MYGEVIRHTKPAASDGETLAARTRNKSERRTNARLQPKPSKSSRACRTNSLTNEANKNPLKTLTQQRKKTKQHAMSFAIILEIFICFILNRRRHRHPHSGRLGSGRRHWEAGKTGAQMPPRAEAGDWEAVAAAAAAS